MPDFEKMPVYQLEQARDLHLFEDACCAFGVFDGMHRGHRFLLDSAKIAAVRHNTESIVITFDQDPDELFRPDSLKKLLTNEDRVSRLAHSGLDKVVLLPFSREFAGQQPADFLLNTFGEDIPMQMHVGIDIHFGSRASGSVLDLQNWGRERGCSIEAHELELSGGAPITATRIRGLLQDGQIEQANDLLGYHYALSGFVQPGRGEGADLGFRTANLTIAEQLTVLGDGVYGAYVVVQGKRYKAAVSVGVSPVFADKTTSNCEVHILGFEGDLYEQQLKVEFVRFIRPLIKFESAEHLSAEVKANIAQIHNELD